MSHTDSIEARAKHVMDLIASELTFANPYDAGFDAGMNGPNTSNCHFMFFSTKARSAEWSRGNDDALAQRATKKPGG